MNKPVRKTKEKEPTLPDSELEAMRILWDLGKGTAREVWENLQQRGSRWTYATVNTLLQRLEAKGLVSVDKSSMSYVYSPIISKQQVVKKRVKQIVDKLYNGQSGMLVMHLLKSQKLSDQELSDIQDLLRKDGTP